MQNHKDIEFLRDSKDKWDKIKYLRIRQIRARNEILWEDFFEYCKSEGIEPTPYLAGSPSHSAHRLIHSPH